MDVLHVESIFPYPIENAKVHHTEKFEIIYDEFVPLAVLRRGFKFIMSVRFTNGTFRQDEDILKLIFNFGPRPKTIKGTKAVMHVHQSKGIVEDKWSCNISSKGDDFILLEIISPPDIPVGLWTVQVETGKINSTATETYDYENGVYILFNPWHKDDLVYMPDERYLDEYILTDVGKIWVGPWGSSKGRAWVFGQFDACVLPATMLMLEFSQMPYGSRKDPIKLSRIISKMVNNNDEDNGVLIGRWDGDYIDGTAPAAWTGSVEILRQYLETQQSVSYGQCWVFSGVVTTMTVCRALGIPSRVVSNLVSAHDANASLTVDKYYNSFDEELNYDPLNEEGEDSVWNYHVWSDAWMARPDLPKGYGGWQAIDATPQEKSMGIYQCGPASLEAIRKGAVGLNYDVAFMVASVNADLMRWKEDPESELGFARIYCNNKHIGKIVLTKKPWIFDPNGDKDREDITTQYKPKEGTEAERLSLYNAVRGTKLAKSFYSLPENSIEDLEFNLLELETIKLGENFNVTVVIKNKCEKVKNIKAVLSASSVYYNGVKAFMVKKAEGRFKVNPKSSEKLQLAVRADDYLDKLVEYCNMKLNAIATVEETKQTWAAEDDFQIVKPTVAIHIDQEIPHKKPTNILLRFINPLKKALTGGSFSITGPKLPIYKIAVDGIINPGGLVKAETQIVATNVGEQKIVVIFSSLELDDITGSKIVEVYQENL